MNTVKIEVRKPSDVLRIVKDEISYKRIYKIKGKRLPKEVLSAARKAMSGDIDQLLKIYEIPDAAIPESVSNMIEELKTPQPLDRRIELLDEIVKQLRYVEY